jgi:hypothetical protein
VVTWLQRELATKYSESVRQGIMSGKVTNKPTSVVLADLAPDYRDGPRSAHCNIVSDQAAMLPTTSSGVIVLVDVVDKLAWAHLVPIGFGYFGRRLHLGCRRRGLKDKPSFVKFIRPSSTALDQLSAGIPNASFASAEEKADAFSGNISSMSSSAFRGTPRTEN